MVNYIKWNYIKIILISNSYLNYNFKLNYSSTEFSNSIIFYCS